MMEMLSDLPTLSTVVEAAALTPAYRLQRPDHKALETGYDRIWNKTEKVGNKFTMTKDHTTTRYSLDKRYQAIKPNRE